MDKSGTQQYVINKETTQLPLTPVTAVTGATTVTLTDRQTDPQPKLQKCGLFWKLPSKRDGQLTKGRAFFEFRIESELFEL